MSWIEITPTSATRPIAPRERFMALIALSAVPPGGEQHVIFSTAVLPKTVTPAQLTEMVDHFKAAWLVLRFEHPSIASNLSADANSIVYTSPTSKQLQDEWLSKTFIVDDTAISTEQIRTRLRDRTSNSLTFAPRARAIMIAMSHWKTDGHAIFQLTGRYLALCNEPLLKLQDTAWGTELDRLVPSLAEIAKLKPEPPQGADSASNQAALDFLKVGSPNGQKLSAEPNAPSADPLSEHAVLNEEETKNIIQACRSRGFGFGSAVHAAAYLHSLSLVDSSWAQKEYKYSVHRDLRSRLPAPWNGIASAGGEMVSSSAASIPPNSNFNAAATVLEKHGREGFTDEKFALDEAMWTRILQILASVKPGDANVPLELLLSSLGIIDQFFDTTKEIMADHIEVGGQAYTAMAGGWAYIYRGRLNMVISYNEAYRSRESIRKYLDSVKAILERELL